tara:strand:+ start:28741 stop:29451 length:711 start_codon:yes stop_codon:yes gene_type:complete
MRKIIFALFLIVSESSFAEEEMPVVFEDNFQSGMQSWFPSDNDRWIITKTEDRGNVLHLLGKSRYQPPHRSPHSIVLLKEQVLGDFVLTAKVKTLQTTRGHRDMCVFFGYQDPAHFYYVHLGEKPDPHSSQIFIVNNAPRTKITETPDVGVAWSDGDWHDVKVVRRAAEGLIEVYFDDMETPQKVAHDKTFQWGMIGLGSFDDLGQWDDVVIRGVKVNEGATLFEAVTNEKDKVKS